MDLRTLLDNINSGASSAHAFIIEGRSGESRTEFVRQMAAGLECTADDCSARPCGTCPSCRQIAAGTSMDVVHMAMSTSKSGRTSYKVEDAAAFIERLSMGAYGRYLIGIIDEADSLSEIIQNKLLKTLEEPSAETVLILAAANRDNMLSTVRSRCSIVRIESSDPEGDSSDQDGRLSAACREMSAMLTDPKAAFYKYRELCDKHIKSREDALAMLETAEDDLRDKMLEAAGGGREEALFYAGAIEKLAEARMDIRREMSHSKALRRLFLELR